MYTTTVHGAHDVRFDDLTPVSPGTGEVRIRPAFNGICGSDIHLIENPETSGYVLRHDADGNLAMPVGHEFSGTVEELGEGVTGVSVGDRVAVFPFAYCGECEACTRGMEECCERPTDLPGCLSSSVTVPQRCVFPLPESVDLHLGALVEPMAVAWHAARLAEVTPEDAVVIAGAGPIGLGLFFALRAQGVEKVVISEPSTERREVAEALGAQVVDATASDFSAQVRALVGPGRPTVGFDAAGSAPAFSAVLRLLGLRGRMVVVAIHTREFAFNPTMALLARERSILHTYAYSMADFREVIDAMAQGHYPTDGWVEVRPASELLDAVEDLTAGEGSKILLEI